MVSNAPKGERMLPGTYTIYTAQLMKYLKIERTTLFRWQKEGALAPETREIGNRYASTDVDDFLAREVHGLDAPPTFKDIMDGRFEIATPNEAAALLGLSVEGVREVMLRGNIGGFRLHRAYRYSVATLHSYLAKRNNNMFLPITTVEHVLTLSRPTVCRLIDAAKLADASETYRRRVTRESLLALLQEMLPNWIDARDWLEDRLESTRPLVTPITIAQTRADKPRVEQLLDARRIQFINNPYGNKTVPRLVSPDSWFAYVVSTESPMDLRNFAIVYNVTRQTIAGWREQYPDYFDCKHHDHPESTLYPTCFMHIIAPHVTKGVGRSATAWYDSTVKEERRPLTVAQAAQILGTSVAEVTNMLENNKLFGLRSPSGRWSISRQSVLGLRNRTNASRKTARS